MSFTPRIFWDQDTNSPLGSGEHNEMSAAIFHYLFVVLRLKSGDEVLLFNERDGEWSAIIHQTAKNKSNFKVKYQIRKPLKIKGPTLVLSPLKKSAMDISIRMATELGVQCIQPIQMLRTNSHYIKEERFRSIAIEAAEQSGRLSVPEIKPLASLSKFCENWPRNKTLWVAVERFKDKQHNIDSNSENYCADDGILIGPEGGFDPHELQKLLLYPFIRPFSLGNLILKAETAVVVSLARWFPFVSA
ncbi:hypothetical protein COMNV_00542 [Commensalibacter sp. Nvir]|uniref:RsmE family RNA methyltransferase n=1 Tax=Commensalibacter sp. Nvir TaxID=3069817 RepID=UPI002D52725D|nr:hypothetical protein COMNV_00542 [Commensalibacter sp. Nvir]